MSIHSPCDICGETKPCRVVSYDAVYMSRPDVQCQECFGDDRWTPHGEVGWDDLTKPEHMALYMTKDHFAKLSARFVDAEAAA